MDNSEVKVEEEIIIGTDPQVTEVIVGDPAHQDILIPVRKLTRNQRTVKKPEERNPEGKGGFADHPENRNRSGKPHSFDILRHLAQRIAEETAYDENGKPITVRGEVITNAEVVLRSMMVSQLKDKFLEIAYGKVPQPVEAKITTWQDEIVKALIEQRMTAEDVYNELGPAAQPLIESAGLRLIEGGSNPNPNTTD
jgi:hypothetical protein